MMSKKNSLAMIWAEEAGVSVRIHEGENDRRIVEIRGLVDDREAVIVTATIARHNRDEFAAALSLCSQRATCSRGAKIGETLEIVP